MGESEADVRLACTRLLREAAMKRDVDGLVVAIMHAESIGLHAEVGYTWLLKCTQPRLQVMRPCICLSLPQPCLVPIPMRTLSYPFLYIASSLLLLVPQVAACI